ncbi:MAG: hypothetical protein ACE5JU_01135 [Candidatus Binatia bacterium]
MGHAKTGILRPLLTQRGEGFTLIEVLAAIPLIVIGILGLAFNTVAVIQGNHISGNITAATNVAQDKLEQLKGLGTALPNCPTATTAGCFDGPLNSQGTTASPGAIYSRSWVISPNSPESGISTIVVTVSWQDYLNRQVELITLVFTG